MNSNQGKCIGVMRYGSVVQFWCESLSGGVTDSVIVPVEFESESMALAVANAVTEGLAADRPLYAYNENSTAYEETRAAINEIATHPQYYRFGSISFAQGGE